MRIQPDGINLLDTVSAVLKDELLPTVPAEQQYNLRMALNAIGIARRQLAAAPQIDFISALQNALSSNESGTALVKVFADAVRAGKAENDPALQELLWRLCVGRVQESAPRYLQVEGIGGV